MFFYLGLEKTTELLIAEGANVDAVDLKGNTALLLAVKKGNKLIENKKWNLKKNGVIKTAFLLTLTGLKRITELLIQKGSDINVLNGRGDSILHLATVAGNFKLNL